jgi:hypothetical protein
MSLNGSPQTFLISGKCNRCMNLLNKNTKKDLLTIFTNHVLLFYLI